jgi:hypothetical protein
LGGRSSAGERDGDGVFWENETDSGAVRAGSGRRAGPLGPLGRPEPKLSWVLRDLGARTLGDPWSERFSAIRDESGESGGGISSVMDRGCGCCSCGCCDCGCGCGVGPGEAASWPLMAFEGVVSAVASSLTIAGTAGSGFFVGSAAFLGFLALDRVGCIKIIVLELR